VRGGCTEPEGPVGGCPECPLARLDLAMATPRGAVVDRAFRLARRKNAGFAIIADTLPADLVVAVELLVEEEREYLDERRHRDEEAAAAQREADKRMGR